MERWRREGRHGAVRDTERRQREMRKGKKGSL